MKRQREKSAQGKYVRNKGNESKLEGSVAKPPSYEHESAVKKKML